MENPIIIPFDLEFAIKIKRGEVEGSVLMNGDEVKFVHESESSEIFYCLLFVKEDGVMTPICATKEGRTIQGNMLSLKVEAGAYFKKGDILISIHGSPFIYNGAISGGDMGCICGISAYNEITLTTFLRWTNICSEDESKYVRFATEEEKKSFAERIANAKSARKTEIIKQYLSEYEYLLTEEKKYDFKPFDQVLVRAARASRGTWTSPLVARTTVTSTTVAGFGR